MPIEHIHFKLLRIVISEIYYKYTNKRVSVNKLDLNHTVKCFFSRKMLSMSKIVSVFMKSNLLQFYAFSSKKKL